MDASGAPTGMTTQLTKEMVDEGLTAMHMQLSMNSSNHYKIKGLHRLPPGSHGVWERHDKVPVYKITSAASICGLAVLLVEFGQKAACVTVSLRNTCVGLSMRM